MGHRQTKWSLNDCAKHLSHINTLNNKIWKFHPKYFILCLLKTRVLHSYNAFPQPRTLTIVLFMFSSLCRLKFPCFQKVIYSFCFFETRPIKFHSFWLSKLSKNCSSSIHLFVLFYDIDFSKTQSQVQQINCSSSGFVCCFVVLVSSNLPPPVVPVQ